MDRAPFIAETVTSLARRAKAIRYQGCRLEWGDVTELHSGRGRVDVEISHRTDSGLLRLSLTVWDDRWVHVHAALFQKHRRVWKSSAEGRFIGQEGAPELVRRFEGTLFAPADLPAVWKSTLANGPQRLC